MTEHLPSSGNTEAVVIIKAAPQVGQRHGETVCCAGLDLYGQWLRLYPVSFRLLDANKKFGRWDRISFKWRRPNDDPRGWPDQKEKRPAPGVAGAGLVMSETVGGQ